MKIRPSRSRSSARSAARPERLFEALEARQLLATITWDGGGDGSTLTQATNWTGDVLPGASDDAVISIGGGHTINFNSGGTFTVNSLTCAEDFNQSSGTLTVAALSTFSGTLNLSGGVITGAGNLSITNTFNWSSSAQINTTTSATLTLGASCTTTLTNGTFGFGRNTTNAGTVNWNSGHIGGFAVPAITFTNSGTFNANPNAGYQFSTNNGQNNTFVNTGTFNKTGTASPTFSGYIFNSSGAINISAGTLNINDGGSMSGVTTVASGATLEFNGGTYNYTSGATFAGTGAWTFASGTVNFAVVFAPAGIVTVSGTTVTLNAGPQTWSDLELSSGTVTGSGNLTISSVLNWSGSAQINTTTSATLTLGASCTTTLTNGTFGFGRDTTNAGTVNWNSGHIGGFAVPAITFTNSGTFNANPNAGYQFSANNGQNNTFVNTGTFNKTGTALPSFTGYIFNSSGAINISAGTLNINDGGSMSGVTTVSSGATLEFNGGTYNYTSGATFAGTGTWTFASGTVNFAVVFAPAGIVTVSGTTVTLNAGPQTWSDLEISSGTVTGSGNLTISSVLNWSGSAQINTTTSATLTLGASCTTTLTNGTFGFGRDTTNAGTVNWNSGHIGGFAVPAITFTNSGTFNANPNAGYQFSANNGQNNTFVNTGTFNKTGTALPSFTGYIFNSSGAINISAGTLNINDGGSMSGVTTVASGATLQFNGGTYNYTSGATFAGTGTWTFASGTVNFGVVFAPAGIVTLSGGTVSLNAGPQTWSDLEISSGTVTGSGNLTISSVLNWSGSAQINTTASATLTLGASCTTTLTNGTIGIGRDTTNAGTVNWNSGHVGDSGTGVGAITFTNSGTFNANPDAGYQFFANNGQNNTFVNTGTFNKTGTALPIFSGYLLNNVGTVNVNGGTLNLGSGGNLQGTWNLAATTFLVLSGGTFTDGTGTISGVGTLQFTGGTHNLTGTVTVNTLCSIDNATLGGAGNIIFNTTTDWNSGTMSGTGTTTIANGVIWTMSTSSTKSLGRTLVNNGHINHSAGFLSFTGGGHLVNSATKVYKFFGTANFSNSGANNSFDNAGVFNEESLSTIVLGAAFNNSGSLNLIGNVFDLDGGGTNTGVRNLALGTVLNYRASYTHGAGSTLSGSGIMNFNGGNQTISGDWTSNGFLQMLQGTLDGAGTLTVSAPFTWGAGTMTGAGAIHISGVNGKLALITSGAHILSRTINNDAVLHFLNGQLTMGGATITNSVGSTFALLPTATIVAGGGTNVINNAGLMKKMGSGTISMDSGLGGIRVNNTGTLEVRNGTLNLDGPISQISATTLSAGTWTVFPGTTLGFGVSVVRTLGASAVVSMLGAGSFAALSTLTTNNGTLNLSLGGTFSTTPFAGTFTNNGTIDMTSDRAFSVTGNFVQGSAGILNVDAFSIARFSRLIVSGTATFGGTLNYQFTGGFVPTPGMVFNFFQAGSTSGTFATTNIPSLPLGAGSITYLATGARLTIA